MRSIKTRFVSFSFGTVKNAQLELPAEDFSANDAACLIRKSYLAYIFNPARACIFSDEVAVSSIGQANFFEGALGGYKSRLDVSFFALVESCAQNWIALACDVVRHRCNCPRPHCIQVPPSCHHPRQAPSGSNGLGSPSAPTCGQQPRQPLRNVLAGYGLSWGLTTFPVQHLPNAQHGKNQIPGYSVPCQSAGNNRAG